MTSVPQGPDKERVLKHINDKVQLVKNKIGKRKQQLASRFAKKQPAESGDDEDEPRPKRARPNTPTDGDIETLRDKVERVSNNTNPYVTHPDIMLPTAKSSSGHPEPEAEAEVLAREKGGENQPGPEEEKDTERHRNYIKHRKQSYLRKHKIHIFNNDNIFLCTLTNAELSILSQEFQFIPTSKSTESPDVRTRIK